MLTDLNLIPPELGGGIEDHRASYSRQRPGGDRRRGDNAVFDDENIVHVSGHINPLSDIVTINTELILSDMETLDKAIQKESKKSKSGDKDSQKLLELYKKWYNIKLLFH